MEHKELLQVVCGSGGGLESGADLRRDQLDLLGRERLPDHPQGWAEGASGKDWDAVDQQLAQPGQPGDMDAQHRIDMQVGAEPEGLGDLGGLPPQRLQGAFQGSAAMPQAAGGIVEMAAVAFGVDHEQAGGADDQVVDVGGRVGDG
jgi:hypothetical protein